MHKVGERIGPYEIVAPIGTGGMAEVYRAIDHNLEREVALKLLGQELSLDPQFRARFVREYRLAAALHHPNIVPIYDAGELADQLYIAMPIVGDANLIEIIKREGPLGLTRTVEITTQVASALEAAHAQGIVHRDVKPANILIAQQGNPVRDHAYLVDFGLTRTVESNTLLTRTGVFLGTPAYMAPEVLRARPIDGRADQYALACTVYQMLTGSAPFVRGNQAALITAHLYDVPPTLNSIRPDLPRSVSNVLERALAKDPDQRYPSMTAFAEALGSAAAEPETDHWRTAALAGAGALAAANPPRVDHEAGTKLIRRREEPASGLRTGGTWLLAAVIAAVAVAALAYGALAFLGGGPRPTDGAVAGASPTISPGSTASATTPLPTPGGSVTASEPPAIWTVFLSTPDLTPVSGPPVPMTATANADVGSFGLVIQILNAANGNVLEACVAGTTCSANVRSPDGNSPSRSYKARIATADSATVLAESPVIVLTLERPPPGTPEPPTPTPTSPQPTPTPDVLLPAVQAGSWDVSYARTSTSGSPPVDLGDHFRRYDLTPDCASIDACRIRARTFETDGDLIGSIVFTWHGNSYDYTGPAAYYRRSGGDECTTGGGDLIQNAYTTREVVELRPERYEEGRVVELVGTKTISGRLTAAGTAAGCQPYTLVYGAHLEL